MRLIFILIIGAGATLWGTKSCVSHQLDEKVFYTGHGLELKVITYFENLPLHFTGNVYRVLCKSEATKDLPKTKYSPAGYQSYLPIYEGLIELGYTSNDDMNIDKLAEVASRGYVVPDDNTVIVNSGAALFVTWDGCASFVNWSLANLPEDQAIESSPDFQSCLERYKSDAHWPHIQQEISKHGSISKACQLSKFSGTNRPAFSELLATKSGFAQAKIKSGGIKSFNTLLVETSDYGKSWSYKFLP